MKQLLTGKCLEDFDKWLQDTHYNNRHDTWIHWSSTTLSMQYGVLVDFFDSVGIYINAFSPDYFEIHTGWDVVMNEGKVDRSRSEARTEAIKKAGELFNEKFN